jgi:C-terminal processing protease CtpA/Prc
VAVLTGPACMSSNESFILMMDTSPRVILVGEHTYGSSGNPKPVDLGNGVSVVLPSWQDFRPGGGAIEGVGIPPDIGVRARQDELAAGMDPVLEAGLRAVRRR